MREDVAGLWVGGCGECANGGICEAVVVATQGGLEGLQCLFVCDFAEDAKERAAGVNVFGGVELRCDSVGADGFVFDLECEGGCGSFCVSADLVVVEAGENGND